jgi:hypothetical protein
MRGKEAMASFRSVLSRGVFAVVLFCGSLFFMGAAFAPSDLPFPLGPSSFGQVTERGTVAASKDGNLFARRSAALSCLEEMILTERVIATSA